MHNEFPSYARVIHFNICLFQCLYCGIAQTAISLGTKAFVKHSVSGSASRIKPSKCTPYRRGSQVTELLQTTIYRFKKRHASVNLLGRRRRAPPLFHGSPRRTPLPSSREREVFGHTTEYPRSHQDVKVEYHARKSHHMSSYTTRNSHRVSQSKQESNVEVGILARHSQEAKMRVFPS